MLHKKGVRMIVLTQGHKYIIEGDLLGYLFSLGDAVNNEDISNVFMTSGKIANYMGNYIPTEYKEGLNEQHANT